MIRSKGQEGARHRKLSGHFFSFVQEDRSHSLKRERHTVKSDQLLRVPLQVPFWERPSEDKAFLNPTFPGVRLSWSACFCLPSLTEKC